MLLHHMDCCGVKELSELAEMDLTREGAVEYLQAVKADLTEEGGIPTYFDWSTGQYVDGTPAETVYHTPAFFVFSQAGNAKDVTARGAYGDYFTSFIIEEGLGTVTETEPRLNENSGNLVKVFVWTVDQEAFKNWTGKPKTAKKRKVA